MPSLVAALSTDARAVNLTLASFLFGFAVCQLVYGPLSDRFGRRPLVLVGMVLYLIASLGCAAAPTIEWLIAGRLLQGMAACCGPVLARAIVRDVYGPVRSAKVLAYIGVALAISPALAPILGGYLQLWFGWRAAFVFVALVGVVLLLAIWAYLAETHPEGARQPLRPLEIGLAYRRLLLSATYQGYTLTVAFVFAGLLAFTAGAPFVFINVMGLSPDRFGMVLVFNVGGFVAGSLAAGRLSQRVGLDPLLFFGVGAALAGGGAMTALGLLGQISVAAVIGPMVTFSVGLGIVLANGIAGAMAPYPEIAGTASALLGFVQMVVAGVAAMVVALFPQENQVPMAAVIAATAAVAFAAFTGLVWMRRKGPAITPSA